MKKNIFLKAVSLALLQSFLIESISQAAPFARPLDVVSSKKPAIRFELPSSVAEIEDSYTDSDDKKLVYLIQDPHTNNSGQLNVAKALDILFKHENLKYIFLEAGSGNESLSFLRQFGTEQQRRVAAGSLLRKADFQATEYLDTTSNHDLVLWGVEDMALYKRSVDAYRSAAKERERFARHLNEIESAVKTLKPRIYHGELVTLDNHFKKFQNEEISLSEWAEILTQKAEKLKLNLNAYASVRGLLELQKLEKAIVFEQANTEQTQAMASLSASDRDEILALAEQKKNAAKYTGNHEAAKAYFSLLNEKIGSGLQKYPELAKYMKYLDAAKSLQAKGILADMDALKDAVYGALITNNDQRLLAQADKMLGYLTKLFRQTLTPDEYIAYKTLRRDMDLVKIEGFINRKIMDLNSFYEKAVFLETGYQDMLQRCEAFYELTFDRDEKFIQNMTSKMLSENQEKAVLITGGFHTANLKHLLKKENISYISITPMILSETDWKRYESMLINIKVAPLAAPSIKTTTNMLTRALTQVAGGNIELAGRVAHSFGTTDQESKRIEQKFQQLAGARLTVTDSGASVKLGREKKSLTERRALNDSSLRLAEQQLVEALQVENPDVLEHAVEKLARAQKRNKGVSSGGRLAAMPATDVEWRTAIRTALDEEFKTKGFNVALSDQDIEFLRPLFQRLSKNEGEIEKTARAVRRAFARHRIERSSQALTDTKVWQDTIITMGSRFSAFASLASPGAPLASRNVPVTKNEPDSLTVIGEGERVQPIASEQGAVADQIAQPKSILDASGGARLSDGTYYSGARNTSRRRFLATLAAGAGLVLTDPFTRLSQAQPAAIKPVVNLAQRKQVLQFLLANVTPGGLPLSYRAPKGYWKKVNSRPDNLDDIMERLLVGEEGFAEAGTVNIYDAAVWQIALSMTGHAAPADAHTKRLSSGTSGELENIRAAEGFQYGEDRVTLPRENAWFYRDFGDRWQMKDPLDGKSSSPAFPSNQFIGNGLRHEDWKPIAGENAWAALIGPLQSAYIKYDGKVPADSDEVFLALSILPAVEAMQSSIGAIYHAPEGTFQKDPRDISNENNFSFYKGLKMLLQVLEQHKDDSEASRNAEKVRGILSKMEDYFKKYAFDSKNGVFYQGGLLVDGEFIPSKVFAVDCQTWGVLALGPEWITKEIGKGNVGTVFTIWANTKKRAGYYKNKVVRGVGFTDGHDILSSEWTFGAVLMAREAAHYYEALSKNSDDKRLGVAATALWNDAGTMREGIEELKVRLSDGSIAYKYANQRYAIPFGWWANPIPSLTSAWSLFTDFPDQRNYFNPFALGGGAHYSKIDVSEFQSVKQSKAEPADTSAQSIKWNGLVYSGENWAADAMNFEPHKDFSGAKEIHIYFSEATADTNVRVQLLDGNTAPGTSNGASDKYTLRAGQQVLRIPISAFQGDPNLSDIKQIAVSFGQDAFYENLNDSNEHRIKIEKIELSPSGARLSSKPQQGDRIKIGGKEAVILKVLTPKTFEYITTSDGYDGSVIAEGKFADVESRIRRTTSKQHVFNPGDRVEVRFEGTWYPATLIWASGGGYTFIAYQQIHDRLDNFHGYSLSTSFFPSEEVALLYGLRKAKKGARLAQEDDFVVLPADADVQQAMTDLQKLNRTERSTRIAELIVLFDQGFYGEEDVAEARQILAGTVFGARLASRSDIEKLSALNIVNLVDHIKHDETTVASVDLSAEEKKEFGADAIIRKYVIQGELQTWTLFVEDSGSDFVSSFKLKRSAIGDRKYDDQTFEAKDNRDYELDAIEEILREKILGARLSAAFLHIPLIVRNEPVYLDGVEGTQLLLDVIGEDSDLVGEASEENQLNQFPWPVVLLVKDGQLLRATRDGERPYVLGKGDIVFVHTDGQIIIAKKDQWKDPVEWDSHVASRTATMRKVSASDLSKTITIPSGARLAIINANKEDLRRALIRTFNQLPGLPSGRVVDATLKIPKTYGPEIALYYEDTFVGSTDQEVEFFGLIDTLLPRAEKSATFKILLTGYPLRITVVSTDTAVIPINPRDDSNFTGISGARLAKKEPMDKESDSEENPFKGLEISSAKKMGNLTVPKDISLELKTPLEMDGMQGTHYDLRLKSHKTQGKKIILEYWVGVAYWGDGSVNVTIDKTGRVLDVNASLLGGPGTNAYWIYSWVLQQKKSLWKKEGLLKKWNTQYPAAAGQTATTVKNPTDRMVINGKIYGGESAGTRLTVATSRPVDSYDVISFKDPSGTATLEIATLGGNIVTHKTGDIQRVWHEGRDAETGQVTKLLTNPGLPVGYENLPQRGGIPTMIGWVGRKEITPDLEDIALTRKIKSTDKSTEFAIHGFFDKMRWKMVSEGQYGDEAMVTLMADTADYPAIATGDAPYFGKYRVYRTYTVSKNSLKVKTRIENYGTKDIRIGFGDHPFFIFKDPAQVTAVINALGIRGQQVNGLSNNMISSVTSTEDDYSEPRHLRPVDYTLTNLQVDELDRAVTLFHNPAAGETVRLTQSGIYSNLHLFVPLNANFPTQDIVAAEPTTSRAGESDVKIPAGSSVEGEWSVEYLVLAGARFASQDPRAAAHYKVEAAMTLLGTKLETLFPNGSTMRRAIADEMEYREKVTGDQTLVLNWVVVVNRLRQVVRSLGKATSITDKNQRETLVSFLDEAATKVSQLDTYILTLVDRLGRFPGIGNNVLLSTGATISAAEIAELDNILDKRVKPYISEAAEILRAVGSRLSTQNLTEKLSVQLQLYAALIERDLESGKDSGEPAKVYAEIERLQQSLATQTGEDFTDQLQAINDRIRALRDPQAVKDAQWREALDRLVDEQEALVERWKVASGFHMASATGARLAEDMSANSLEHLEGDLGRFDEGYQLALQASGRTPRELRGLYAYASRRANSPTLDENTQIYWQGKVTGYGELLGLKIEDTEAGARLTAAGRLRMVKDDLPANYGAWLRQYGIGLTVESVDVKRLKGRMDPAKVMQEPMADFVLPASASAALGASMYAGFESSAIMEDDKKEQIEKHKTTADANAVFLNHMALINYTQKTPDVAIVVLGDEGKRDKSTSLQMGSYYYQGRVHGFNSLDQLKTDIQSLKGRGVRVHFQVADALEKTNGILGASAMEEPTDSTSLLALFDDWQEFLIDDQLRIGGVSYNAPTDAGITPFDLPSQALKKIAGAKGVSLETLASQSRILTLGPRRASLEKDEYKGEGHRHDAIILDAMRLSEQFDDLEFTPVGDGDAMPRIVASLGINLDGRQLVVFGRSGIQEAFSSLLATGSKEGQLAFSMVSTTATNKNFSVDTAHGYSEAEEKALEAVGVPSEFARASHDKSAKPSSGLLAMTSITGASPEIFGTTFADNMQRVTFKVGRKTLSQNEVLALKNAVAGSVTVNTLYVARDGSAFIIKTVFQSADIKKSLEALQKVSPEAQSYFENGTTDKQILIKLNKSATEILRKLKESSGPMTVDSLFRELGLKSGSRDNFRENLRHLHVMNFIGTSPYNSNFEPHAFVFIVDLGSRQLQIEDAASVRVKRTSAKSSDAPGIRTIRTSDRRRNSKDVGSGGARLASSYPNRIRSLKAKLSRAPQNDAKRGRLTAAIARLTDELKADQQQVALEPLPNIIFIEADKVTVKDDKDGAERTEVGTITLTFDDGHEVVMNYQYGLNIQGGSRYRHYKLYLYAANGQDEPIDLGVFGVTDQPMTVQPLINNTAALGNVYEPFRDWLNSLNELREWNSEEIVASQPPLIPSTVEGARLAGEEAEQPQQEAVVPVTTPATIVSKIETVGTTYSAIKISASLPVIQALDDAKRALKSTPPNLKDAATKIAAAQSASVATVQDPRPKAEEASSTHLNRGAAREAVLRQQAAARHGKAVGPKLSEQEQAIVAANRRFRNAGSNSLGAFNDILADIQTLLQAAGEEGAVVVQTPAPGPVVELKRDKGAREPSERQALDRRGVRGEIIDLEREYGPFSVGRYAHQTAVILAALKRIEELDAEGKYDEALRQFSGLRQATAAIPNVDMRDTINTIEKDLTVLRDNARRDERMRASIKVNTTTEQLVPLLNQPAFSLIVTVVTSQIAWITSGTHKADLQTLQSVQIRAKVDAYLALARDDRAAWDRLKQFLTAVLGDEKQAIAKIEVLKEQFAGNPVLSIYERQVVEELRRLNHPDAALYEGLSLELEDEVYAPASQRQPGATTQTSPQGARFASASLTRLDGDEANGTYRNYLLPENGTDLPLAEVLSTISQIEELDNAGKSVVSISIRPSDGKSSKQLNLTQRDQVIPKGALLTAVFALTALTQSVDAGAALRVIRPLDLSSGARLLASNRETVNEDTANLKAFLAGIYRQAKTEGRLALLLREGVGIFNIKREGSGKNQSISLVDSDDKVLVSITVREAEAMKPDPKQDSQNEARGAASLFRTMLQRTSQIIPYDSQTSLQGFVEIPMADISRQLPDESDYRDAMNLLFDLLAANRGNYFINTDALSEDRAALANGRIAENNRLRTDYPKGEVVSKVIFTSDPNKAESVNLSDNQLQLQVAGFGKNRLPNLIGALRIAEEVSHLYSSHRVNGQLPKVQDAEYQALLESLATSDVMKAMRQFSQAQGKITVSDLDQYFRGRVVLEAFILKPILAYLNEVGRALQLIRQTVDLSA